MRAAAVLLFVVIAATGARGRPPAVRKPAMREALNEPVRLLSISLAAQGLTYEPSEMGKEADRVPEPLTFHPSFGLYLMDPRSSTLQRFGADGTRVFSVSLRKTLSVPEDARIDPIGLQVDERGSASLAYRISADARIVHVATFDAAGELRAKRTPGCLERADTALPSVGTTWTVGHRDGRAEVVGCSATGLATARVSAGDGTKIASLARGRVLVVTPAGETSVLEPNGQQVVVGTRVDEDAWAAVSGDGAFAGVLVQKQAPKGPDARGMYDDGAVLQILMIERRKDRETLRLVGTASLSLSKGEFDRSRDDEHHFDLVDPRWMRFDAHGTLFLVSRSGPQDAALTVYKLELSGDLAKQAR